MSRKADTRSATALLVTGVQSNHVNTEWRQRARCYRPWNFSKGWKLSSDTQQLFLHSNLAFLKFSCFIFSLYFQNHHAGWSFFEEEEKEEKNEEENLTNSIDLLNWYIQYLLALKLSHLCVKVLCRFDQIFYRRACMKFSTIHGGLCIVWSRVYISTSNILSLSRLYISWVVLIGFMQLQMLKHTVGLCVAEKRRFFVSFLRGHDSKRAEKWKRRYERYKCCWVILSFTFEVQKFTK